MDGIKIPVVNRNDAELKILERDKEGVDHWLCEEHLTKDRRSSGFVNALIHILGIKQSGETLSKLGTSISGLLFGLQPHVPNLFSNEKVLLTLVDRLTYNFGVDADLFRGKPIAYDVECEDTVVNGVYIQRAKTVKRALTLELLFKSDSGLSTPENVSRSDHTSLKIFKAYAVIKKKIRQKIREETQMTDDSVLFYDEVGDLLQESWTAVFTNDDGTKSM